MTEAGGITIGGLIFAVGVIGFGATRALGSAIAAEIEIFVGRMAAWDRHADDQCAAVDDLCAHGLHLPCPLSPGQSACLVESETIAVNSGTAAEFAGGRAC